MILWLSSEQDVAAIDTNNINNKEFKCRNITLSRPIICRHCLLWLTEKKIKCIFRYAI